MSEFIDQDRLSSTIKRHEGLRLEMYKDSVGKHTIGYGHNLDDLGITQEQADKLFSDDITKVIYELLGIPEFRAIKNKARREVLINMSFNLGLPKLLGFRKMWAAVMAEAWEAAADEMLDSRWARQVGHRAVELSEIMRAGCYGD